MTFLQAWTIGWIYAVFRTQRFIVQSGGFGLVFMVLCWCTWPLLFVADLCRIIWP